jgi:hypothetical protein
VEKTLERLGKTQSGPPAVVRLAGGDRWPEKGRKVARVVIVPTLDRFLAVVGAEGLLVMAGGGVRVFRPLRL